MISKKAEEYIDSRAKYENEFLSSAEEIIRIVVPIMSAMHAVDLAEDEMIEKAAKAFSEHWECMLEAANALKVAYAKIAIESRSSNKN